MNIEEIRNHCNSKSGVEESFPFDETTLVFKVGGKMFLLIGLTNADRFNVKCDPEMAVALREQYACVVPGWHMSKKHWNTIHIDGSVSNSMLETWINNSYDLVFSSLPLKVKQAINPASH
jgi:predicted DNA-binding protein (MmcQ/YjbR family)